MQKPCKYNFPIHKNCSCHSNQHKLQNSNIKISCSKNPNPNPNHTPNSNPNLEFQKSNPNSANLPNLTKFQPKFQIHRKNFTEIQQNPEIPEIPEISQNSKLIYNFIVTHHLLSSIVLLSCRLVIFLPCLPVLLFCRFCRAVLRILTRTATRLITCVVATGTFPIRTAWWICRWLSGAQGEYDYFADGAPVVSCAVRAAMSGRRQTRPPAILGEIDNCECNACVWRRAHEATLPAGKQTAPIRRRPTPVGPRRMRRFLRFCSCIPDPTLIQRIRSDSTAGDDASHRHTSGLHSTTSILSVTAHW
jgi:hypothetical protein